MTILPINRKNTPEVLLILPETNNNVVSIYKNYTHKLGQKEFVDIDTLASQGCSGEKDEADTLIKIVEECR